MPKPRPGTLRFKLRQAGIRHYDELGGKISLEVCL